MPNDEKWKQAAGWVGADVDDNFVMLHFEVSNYVSLNPTAKAIWDQLETPKNESQIVDALLTKFVVERDVCARNVTETIEDFKARDLIEPA